MRVVLLCHGATQATRQAEFAGTQQLPEAAVSATTALAGALPRVDAVRRSPAPCCATATLALRLDAEVDAELAGCDFGSWTGRTLDEMLAVEPEAIQRWLTDPTARPHGGESLADLLGRVGGWLDALEERTGGARAVLALADPTVVRAAISYAVGAGAGSLWRFDVTPLCQVLLAGSTRRWSLRSLSSTTAGR
jgi:broad specificity phosphatase PhoE